MPTSEIGEAVGLYLRPGTPFSRQRVCVFRVRDACAQFDVVDEAAGDRGGWVTLVGDLGDHEARRGRGEEQREAGKRVHHTENSGVCASGRRRRRPDGAHNSSSRNDEAKREFSEFFMMVPSIWDAEDEHPFLNWVTLPSFASRTAALS